jgi:hypothetical protein
MIDEYLVRCVVDPIKKSFYLYSSEGSEKHVICDNVDQFMNVLSTVRETLDDRSELVYTNL